MTGRLNGAIRLLACVLIGATGLLRLAHEETAGLAGATPTGHSDAVVSHCSHSDSSHSSHSDSPGHNGPVHDAEHCAVCHLLAVGTTGIVTKAPTGVVFAPRVEQRVPPVVVEPHCADVALPLSARAPPLA